jgi:hypothetical protein
MNETATFALLWVLSPVHAQHKGCIDPSCLGTKENKIGGDTFPLGRKVKSMWYVNLEPETGSGCDFGDSNPGSQPGYTNMPIPIG